MTADVVEGFRSSWSWGVRPSAPGADLGGADLRGADLEGADLRGADLRGADLEGADLEGADLRGADLRGADLWGADLEGADLRGADLGGADLRDANLRDADLRGTQGGILQIAGLPSGVATLTPTCHGWHLRVGCWTGTVATMRALIATDTGWPEATGDEITRRRPGLTALTDLCDAHTTTHPDDLAAVAHWSKDTP